MDVGQIPQSLDAIYREKRSAGKVLGLGTGASDRLEEIEAAHRQAEALIAETGAGLVEPDLQRSRAALARVRGR